LAVIVALPAGADIEHPSAVPPFIEVGAERSLEAERAGLEARLTALDARLAAHNARCAHVSSTDASEVAACRRSQSTLVPAIASYRAALAAYQARCAAAPRRQYRYVGSGFVGGTTWRTGYYSPIGATAEQRARASEMLRQQSRLAGIPYDEAVDLERYNFVIGVAASTSAWTDLRTRVIFDQLHNGQFTPDAQTDYNTLKDRQFDELGCHSNGAMVCLAALTNQDVRADRVVLYGPQITPESLAMWNELLASGRIQALDIYMNEHDPVPAAALLANRAPAEHAARLARAMLFGGVDTTRQTVQEISPQAQIHTFACSASDQISLDCHSMALYSADRRCEDAHPTAASGTSVRGTSAQAPPGLQCIR